MGNVYSGHDWVVKVDPDAVFVPERLKDRIQWMPRTTSGVMLQNCEYVDYGFFGNLEVISGKAFGVLVGNLDTCYTEVGVKICSLRSACQRMESTRWKPSMSPPTVHAQRRGRKTRPRTRSGTRIAR